MVVLIAILNPFIFALSEGKMPFDPTGSFFTALPYVTTWKYCHATVLLVRYAVLP